MADKSQVVECSQCGRLHEVDPQEVGDSFECECGKTLEVLKDGAKSEGGGDDAVTDAAEGADGTQAAASHEGEATEGTEGGEGTLAALKRHWKMTIAIAGAVVVALVLVSFWRGPGPILGHPGGGGGNIGSSGPAEDPEVYLRILEDNDRVGEHAGAASNLLRMEHPAIVPRLCQIAERSDLVSRPLAVHILGQKQDGQALEILGKLVNGDDATLALAAATAVARIGSPLAESMLGNLVRVPSRAREVLPSIASARNALSARILTSALEDPSLRTQVMEEIGKARVEECLPALAAMATDRTIIEGDRIKSIETIGRFKCVEARRVLIHLSQDNSIGWKARQMLEDQAGL